MSEYCYFVLTCADKDEADKISDALLEQRLVVCAKKCSVDSNFLWKGNKDSAAETMLLLTSRTDLFSKIEELVSSLHSYETFVLESMPIQMINKSAAEWIDSMLDNSRSDNI